MTQPSASFCVRTHPTGRSVVAPPSDRTKNRRRTTDKFDVGWFGVTCSGESISGVALMSGKKLFVGLVVVIAAVIPYLLSDDEWLAKIERRFSKSASAKKAAESPVKAKQQDAGTAAEPDASLTELVDTQTTTVGVFDASGNQFLPDGVTTLGTPPAMVPTTGIVPAPGMSPKGPIETSSKTGPTAIPLEHLLSFNVTPEWIHSNWSHVTTSLSDVDLKGWRVPVALDAPYDLVGSVTWYFDPQRRVQRIQLHGFSENASGLLGLATSRYGMRRLPSTDTELFTAQIAGQTVGALSCDFSPILKDDISRRCRLSMELNRQGSEYGLSHNFTSLLQNASERSRLLAPGFRNF